MLTVSHLQKSYGARQVLCGLDFEVAPGEAVCVAGKNGQGKTTLLSIVAGVRRADGGQVHASGPVAFVPQQAAVLPGLTVRDNLWLWYGAWGRGRGEVFAPGCAEEQLGLLPFARKKAGELSGGYLRRLSIAGALAGRPAFLVLDEPFAGLDVDSAQLVTGHLRQLCRGGMGVLFSSHQPDRIAALADRLLVLGQGRFERSARLDRAAPHAARLEQVMGALGVRIEDR